MPNLINIHPEVLELRHMNIWTDMTTPLWVRLLHDIQRTPSNSDPPIILELYHHTPAHKRKAQSLALRDTTVSCVPYHTSFPPYLMQQYGDQDIELKFVSVGVLDFNVNAVPLHHNS